MGGKLKDKSRVEYWKNYSTENAIRVDEIYKSSGLSLHLKAMMIEELKSIAPVIRVDMPGEAPHVLDVGCGTGDVACDVYDAGYRVTGLDISESMLGVFRTRVGDRIIPVTIGDVFSMQAPASLYDVAIARCVFSHYANFGELLSAIARQVRVGGYIIFDSFGEDAIFNASSVLDMDRTRLIDFVFEKLSYFSSEELIDFCGNNNIDIVSRRSASFFHRNPLLSSGFELQADYDAELGRHFRNEGVAKFMMWFERQVASTLPVAMSGCLLNVVRKIG